MSSLQVIKLAFSITSGKFIYPSSESLLTCYAGELLYSGGGLATLLQSFMNLASVMVEEMWMKVYVGENATAKSRDSLVLRVLAKTIGLLFSIIILI